MLLYLVLTGICIKNSTLTTSHGHELVTFCWSQGAACSTRALFLTRPFVEEAQTKVIYLHQRPFISIYFTYDMHKVTLKVKKFKKNNIFNSPIALYSILSILLSWAPSLWGSDSSPYFYHTPWRHSGAALKAGLLHSLPRLNESPWVSFSLEVPN